MGLNIGWPNSFLFSGGYEKVQGVKNKNKRKNQETGKILLQLERLYYQMFLQSVAGTLIRERQFIGVHVKSLKGLTNQIIK